jgi:hypothetical protein
VFVQKRPEFNMAEARTAELDLEAVQHDARREVLVAANKNKHKWKKESNTFRESLRAAREYQKAVAEGRDPPPPPPAATQADDSLVQCPHCSRRFAEHTAERHIPHCANTKARPNMLQRGTGKGIGAAATGTVGSTAGGATAAAAAAPGKRR